MDWFLYDIGLRRERVDLKKFSDLLSNHLSMQLQLVRLKIEDSFVGVL